MRVMVTGHKGYIGVRLVPMLLERGHEVVGYDSDLFAACDYGGTPVAVPEIVKDIRDARVEDLHGVDAVLHLAGLSNDPLGDLDPDLTYAINTHATVRLGALAREAGVQRFVFASSCSNYGASGDALLDEGADLNPVTPYGRSKVLAEQGLKALVRPDFCPVFLRNATAYGFSCRVRFDLVLNNLVAWALTTGRIYIKSDGTPWRPIVHIEDIARAFLAALEADPAAIAGQAFNVGRNEDNYRIREIAEMVREIVPGSRVDYAPDGGPDKRCYRVDSRRIHIAMPGFTPRWTARDGIREMYDRLGAHGLSLEAFEGERYQRIAHIRGLLARGTLGPDLRRKVAA